MIPFHFKKNGVSWKQFDAPATPQPLRSEGGTSAQKNSSRKEGRTLFGYPTFKKKNGRKGESQVQYNIWKFNTIGRLWRRRASQKRRLQRPSIGPEEVADTRTDK
ncbi:hypothetical protein CEXT_188781 [Caerostris extrusa]|uniref:Uncharacterized protein n=1 Tax=Caerostris extrusa TaxID=172846 RepID=A0AAV4NN66_CAEEX|nr:hypothetical protein CEXT_188781 [Caerostris extrusa]